MALEDRWLETALTFDGLAGRRAREKISPLLWDGGGLLTLRGSIMRPRPGGLFAALFDVVALAEVMYMCGKDLCC